MGKWNKIEEALDRMAFVIASAAFIAMVVLTSGNVISRYIFSRSFNWAEEVSYLCFNWAVFFGVALVYRDQGLTAIDLIVERLRGAAKKGALIFGYLLVSLANAGLIVWGLQFSVNAWQRKSPALHIPYFFYDISIPLAAVLLLLHSLKFLIRTVRGEEVKAAALEDRV